MQNLEYDFSDIGNLTRRADVNQNVAELFTSVGGVSAYDAQNRLKNVQRVVNSTGAVQATTSFTYDALGNLLTKGGIGGAYNYTATPQGSCPSGYTTAPGPHAVRRTGTSGGGYQNLCYDHNGNQTRGWNYVTGEQRLQTWTSYNLPLTTTEAGHSITFSYDAERQRFRQVNAFTGQTIISVEGLFDREVTGATYNDLHYILAYGKAVAVFSSDSTGASSTKYLHRDQLGSVTHVTSSAGAVLQTLSYDVWGKQRNGDWTDPAGAPARPDLRSPGYTGHEGLYDVNLVHMNGRIYDPSLGRMLSPDPIVQFTGEAQNYNRYSYVLNNPARYTDPTGFCLRVGPCPNESGGLAVSGGRAGPSRTLVTPGTKLWTFFSMSMAEVWNDRHQTEYTWYWAITRVPIFNVEPVVTYSYSSVVADPAGDSSGGAEQTRTVAGYEGNYVGAPVPNGTGRIFSPDGATSISAAEYDEYLSKRSRLTAALENTSEAWWQVRLDLQKRIAALDHDLNCALDRCSVESTLGPVELFLLGPELRGAGALEEGLAARESVQAGRSLGDVLRAERGAIGDSPPILRRIHSAETITSGSSRYSYEYWGQQSTEDIVRSLRPGSDNPLTIKPDGRIIDGNTRTLILEQRGFNVNSLPRVVFGD